MQAYLGWTYLYFNLITQTQLPAKILNHARKNYLLFAFVIPVGKCYRYCYHVVVISLLVYTHLGGWLDASRYALL